MTREPPTNVRSLDARLRNLARAQGLVEGRVRRIVATTVLGQLLARTGEVAVKGASNLELRSGLRATRASSDVDAVRRTELEPFREALESALREGWCGFTGELADRGVIDAPVPDGYRPRRFQMRLFYRGHSFRSVTLEVSPEEVGGLDIIDLVRPAEVGEWFTELGLPVPEPVPALPLDHQIAQKLHACTAPDRDGWVNGRAHDLVDLQLALAEYDGSPTRLRTVAVRLFAARNGHPWPPTVTRRHNWVERYAEEAEGLAVLGRLHDALAWANRLIEMIDKAY